METPNGGALGFLVLIELPMRELMLELMRLLKLPADGRCGVEMVGFLVLIELSALKLLLEPVRLLELTDKLLSVPGLVIVDLLLIMELLVG